MYMIRNHALGDSLIMENDDGSLTFIPFSEENSDYQQYLKWLEEGNTPEPWNPGEV